jgi:hypothetical protein
VTLSESEKGSAEKIQDAMLKDEARVYSLRFHVQKLEMPQPPSKRGN